MLCQGRPLHYFAAGDEFVECVNEAVNTIDFSFGRWAVRMELCEAHSELMRILTEKMNEAANERKSG